MTSSETSLPKTSAKSGKKIGDDIHLVTLQCDNEEEAARLKAEIIDILFKDRITGRDRVKQLTLRRMNWFERLIFLFKWEKYEILKAK